MPNPAEKKLDEINQGIGEQAIIARQFEIMEKINFVHFRDNIPLVTLPGNLVQIISLLLGRNARREVIANELLNPNSPYQEWALRRAVGPTSEEIGRTQRSWLGDTKADTLDEKIKKVDGRVDYTRNGVNEELIEATGNAADGIRNFGSGSSVNSDLNYHPVVDFILQIFTDGPAKEVLSDFIAGPAAVAIAELPEEVDVPVIEVRPHVRRKEKFYPDGMNPAAGEDGLSVKVGEPWTNPDPKPNQFYPAESPDKPSVIFSLLTNRISKATGTMSILYNFKRGIRIQLEERRKVKASLALARS